MTAAFLFAALLAGSAPPAWAKPKLPGKLGDILNAVQEAGKASKEEKEASESGDEDAQQAADKAQDAGIGKLLKSVGVNRQATEAVTKTVGLGRRTKRARAAAADLDPEQEHQIGRVVAAEILAQYKPLEDEGLNRYLQAVGQAAAAVSDRPETFGGYHFQALDTDEVNALSILGGFVFVTKGLLRLLESEDQLACVLAHEVAHVALGHGTEAILKSRRMKTTLAIAADATKTFGKDPKAVQDLENLRGNVKNFMELLLRTGYGHDKEFEADAQGALYAQRTGYDPRALAAVLRRIEAAGAAKGGFLKTHPPAGRRAERLEGASLEPPAHYRASKARGRRFSSSLASL